MIFYVSGEGKTDIGVDDTHPGPLLEALKCLAISASDEDVSFKIISRHELADRAKCMTTNRKAMFSRGRKLKYPGVILVRRYAHALASKVKDIGEEAGAVLFHDCDYANAVDGDAYYREMVLAVQAGFASVDSSTGVQ